MSLNENIPSSYVKLLDKPVAVFGLGAGGSAVADLLEKLNVEHVTYDQRIGEDGSVFRLFDNSAASGHSLVIHSPAFQEDHPWIKIATEGGCTVVSEIDFAQQLRNGPTLVITGTNGKTTLQEFCTFCLKRYGISAVAAGQNGYPLSRLAMHPELDGVTAVCELGPFYVKPLKAFRFDALFWTNFHEDHFDDISERRSVFEEYKRLLELSPSARFYLGDSVIEEAKSLGCSLPDEVMTPRIEDYPDWDLPDTSAFATSIHRPALALFRRYWLDMGYPDSVLKSAAEHFEVRAHRLHALARVANTVFWNDANAGNFAATIAAIENFAEPVVWIGGGHYRGGDLSAFVEKIQPKLKGAVITGNAAWHLLPIFEDKHIPCKGVLNLQQGVEAAFELAGDTSAVVFSPGFVTGDDYGDLVERGICFENAVLGLKHQKGNV